MGNLQPLRPGAPQASGKPGFAVPAGRAAEAGANSAEAILKEARIRFREYRCNSPFPIWLTAGNQLMASYTAMSRFARVDRHYAGWHAHHVVESQDLDRLGVANKFPPYPEQLTVLLPQAAHIKRVNSVLRNQAPMSAVMPAADVLAAYAAAYALMGNYSGGGEQRIRTELMAIARAIFRRAGLI
jgi:hypothetical protein